MNEFYVYYIIDPRTCQPIYVGKGKNRWMYDHWNGKNSKRCNHLLKRKFKEIELAGLEPIYQEFVHLSMIIKQLVDSYGNINHNHKMPHSLVN